MKFKTFLETRYDQNYLSIGHNFDGRFDTYFLKPGTNDIYLASEHGKDPESLHGDLKRYDYKGRIDHDKQKISVVPWFHEQERFDQLVKILKARFPNYSIWLFGTSSQPIQIP